MMVMVIENRAQNDGTGPKYHQKRSRYILARPIHATLCAVPINDPINDPQYSSNTNDPLVNILLMTITDSHS